MTNLSLFYNNPNHRGPGKVVQNLKKGLEQLQIISIDNQYDKNNFSGILQPHSILNQNNIEIKNFILGPNLFVLPNEWGKFCQKFNNYIVPSNWIYKKYRDFSELDHAKINIWSVGIDTDKWNISLRKKEKNLKCLLYFKNRSLQDLAVAKKILSKYNIEYKELIYGSYSEEELFSSCSWADFGILLTNTESQGIAYMEILSTNLPCFVFNKTTWNNEGRYKSVEATSVPYFDKRCGEIVDDVNLVKFEEFLNNIDKNLYNPRDYIIENHTLKISATNYINLFATI